MEEPPRYLLDTNALNAAVDRGIGSLGPKNIPTSAAVYDISEWDHARWSDDDSVYSTLLQRVTELDLKKGRKKKLENQVRDAVIGNTAIKEGLILVTNDTSLTTATAEAGGSVITFEQFVARLGLGS